MKRIERPLKRVDINHFLEKYDWSLSDLKKHVDTNKHRFSKGFRTQLNKMIEEKKEFDFKKNLSFEVVDGLRFPVVFCVEEEGQWVFYCPFCRRKHRHSPFPGFRHSHCHNPGSPFNQGYVLKLKRGDVS